MRIVVTSVYVDDQSKALAFYTDVLGFTKKQDVPMGEHRWLTVVSPDDPDGTELLLEPAGHPAVAPFRDALVSDGIPFTSFGVALLLGGCHSSKPPPHSGNAPRTHEESQRAPQRGEGWDGKRLPGRPNSRASV